MTISALVLAGGKGTRMGEICTHVPKPMLAFNGYPFLQYQVSWLFRSGCGQVVIVIGHLGEKIAEVFGTQQWHARGVRLVDGGEPKGTAHAIATGLTQVSNEHLILCNGDTIAEFPFDHMRELFTSLEKHPLMTLLTRQIGVQNQGAILVSNGVVIEFKEGDTSGVLKQPFQDDVYLRASSTGCYFMQTAFAQETVLETDVSYERVTLPRLVDNQLLAGYDIGNGRVIDYGTPERYRHLQEQAETLVQVYGEPLL